jgi:putative redox protein
MDGEKMPKIKAKATWIENVKSTVDNQRGHTVTCDLSTPAGGTDCGPTALELTMMALADCGVTIFADVCKKSNIKLKKVEVTVEADKSPDAPIVSGVTMRVNASSDARKELLEAAWRRTEANCPVLVIFKEPTPVKVEFEGKTE